MKKRFIRNERGAALIEAAVTIPIILLISVGIFEFAMAFQTWQVLTNGAREGARVAVIEGTTDSQVDAAVHNYLQIGGIEGTGMPVATVTINRAVPLVGSTTASEVMVTYPFKITVLDGVMRMVSAKATNGASVTNLGAKAIMRNE